jgi:hypothetical protein
LLHSAAFSCVLGSTPATSKSTSLKLPAPQHFRSKEPFFSPHEFMKRLIYVAFYIRSLDLGFGYPLAKSYSPSALGWPLSAPNTLGLLPSELFSSPAVERAFQLLLSTLALIKKTSRLSLRASAASSGQSDRPLPLLPEGLVRVRGSCSPGTFDLSGSLLFLVSPQGISTSGFPSRRSTYIRLTAS